MREHPMSRGVKTVIYPVQDLARAKATFTELLGAEPSSDSPYYVGFTVGDQEIGLDPNGHKHGTTPYWHVAAIDDSVDRLVKAGAEVLEAAKDVGGGRVIAVLKDAEGNIIGLVQD
jgi:predicted enzyme related to lactoylglutathione lyase